MGRALVIGVGSDLRRDDAVGRHVAERVEALGLAGVEVLAATQLVPELVERIDGSDRVVVVDASVAADGVEVTEVEPLAASGGSHHATPEGLLALAARLGLDCPTAFLVQIAAHDLSLGEGLSDATASLVDDAVTAVLALLEVQDDGPDLAGADADGETSIMAEVTPEIVELDPQEAITVRGEMGIADLPGFFERAFHEAAEAASAAGAEIVGPAFGFYPEMPTDTVTVEAGFPVSTPVETTGNAHRFVVPGGRAVQVIHVGPFDTLETTYGALLSWMTAQGLQPAAGMWESYLSDPTVEPDPANWQTRIVCPVA